jgi:hypothetical protein
MFMREFSIAGYVELLDKFQAAGYKLLTFRIQAADF